MTNDFNWRTDEEEGWEEPLTSPRSTTGRRSWLVSRWRLLLPVVLAGVLIGSLLYRQYQQRLAAIERDVAADLLSGAETVRRAMIEGDLELFRLNLSGRDPNWTEAQVALLEERLLLGRETFGLSWTGEVDAPAQDAVTVSPDLTSGQVPLLVTFETRNPRGQSATVRLQLDQIYRQANDRRWLLAPPLEPYWGPWQTVDLGPMEIFVSQRDADLVRRLAADLSADANVLCAALDDCRPVEVRLVREPASLLALSREAWILGAGERAAAVTLPTPTLVGTPIDDAGYAALLDGYRRHLLGTLYARALGMRCCRNGLLLQAFIEHRLAELGLGQWPMTPELYGELLTRWRGPDDMEALFSAPADAGLRGEQWPAAFALIDYGFTNFPESARVGLAEKLPNLATFAGLLRHLMPLDDRERPLAWATFLNQRQEAGAPVWPDGYDLTLGCRSQASFFDVALYSYRPGRELINLGTVEGPATLFDVPAVDGYLVQRIRTVEDDQIPQVSYWLDGQERAVAAGQAEQILAMGYESWVQSLERFVPLWQLNGGVENRPSFALLDAASCESGACRATPLPGFPDIAPGGGHVLTIDFAGTREQNLGLSTTAAPDDITWLPRSRWAFWISPERFATINWDGSVHVATVDAPAASNPVVTAAELVAGLPEELRPPSGRAEISDGFANPTDPDQLYLFIAPDRGLSSRSTLLLVRYDVGSGAVTLVGASQSTYHYPQFSPDGRWLALWSDAQGRYRQESKLTIVDTTRPERPALELSAAASVNVRWLPENERLLINHGRFARLYAPDVNRTALFTLPDGLWCQQTFWRSANGE